jgi:hypothetical protein
LQDYDLITTARTSDDDTLSTSSTLKKALRRDKNYLQLYEKYIYKFEDIFIDKLPNKLPSLDSPRYRIILEDEKISINSQMFYLLT